MRVKQILGAATTSAVLIAGLAGGLVGAQTASIETTGPDSTNIIVSRNSMRVRVHNDNDVDAHNSNHQHSYSGDAEVEHNTTGGSAKSGNASNANTLNASVTLDNTGTKGALTPTGGGSWNGSIEETGPDSVNKVIFKNYSSVCVSNDNDLDVNNYSSQHASTGDAEVEGNTTGGSATSGNASNTNAATFTLKVTN